MRNNCEAVMSGKLKFLSIQAQDFIEDVHYRLNWPKRGIFLSIQAQDFIEDVHYRLNWPKRGIFLSIQAQDFIEDHKDAVTNAPIGKIPEHSSSGLH